MYSYSKNDGDPKEIIRYMLKEIIAFQYLNILKDIMMKNNIINHDNNNINSLTQVDSKSKEELSEDLRNMDRNIIRKDKTIRTLI